MFNYFRSKTSTKIRYGKDEPRKSSYFNSLSKVFYADKDALGLSKGHYCIPIKRNDDGTCDVVTLTSLSLYDKRYEDMLRYYKKHKRVNKKGIIPIKMYGKIYFVVEGKLRQIMNGQVKPGQIELGNSLWEGINTEVIENVSWDSLKETNNKKLYL